MDAKSLMEPGKLVDVAIKGLRNNQFDIYPGLARVIKFMSRIAPSFLLKQMSKPVDAMLSRAAAYKNAIPSLHS